MESPNLFYVCIHKQAQEEAQASRFETESQQKNCTTTTTHIC